jgi:hypothetical protein
MQFADESDVLSVKQHAGSAPRMQGRMLQAFKAQSARRKQGFEVGFEIEEIDIARALPPLLFRHRTVGNGGDALGLVVTGHRQGTVSRVSARR